MVDETSTITPITDVSELNGYLEKNDYVLLKFYATWCGPCNKIKPKIVQMSKSYTQVKFLEADADSTDELCTKFNVSSIPAFVTFFKKTVVKNTAGGDPDTVKGMLETLIAKK